MVSEASTKYYEIVSLAKTVQQQQILLQLIMIYFIAHFRCLPFINIFRLNYFGTIYKLCLPEKAAFLDPLISLFGFQQLLRAPLPNPFGAFGSLVYWHDQPTHYLNSS